MTSRRILEALALATFMFFQCSAKTLGSRKNRLSEVTINTTTVYPVKTQVFTADDYDVLQDAESLHQAMTIAAYEPQKLDVKKSKRRISSNNEIVNFVEKTTQPSSTTTSLPPERKYYEVPRKQPRRRAYVKPERKIEDDSKRNSCTDSPTSTVKSFLRNRQEIVTTDYPSMIEETTLFNPDNYHVAASRKEYKIDQKPAAVEIETSTIGKKRRKLERNDNQKLLALTDRLPRPFSLSRQAPRSSIEQIFVDLNATQTPTSTTEKPLFPPFSSKWSRNSHGIPIRSRKPFVDPFPPFSQEEDVLYNQIISIKPSSPPAGFTARPPPAEQTAAGSAVPEKKEKLQTTTPRRNNRRLNLQIEQTEYPTVRPTQASPTRRKTPRYSEDVSASVEQNTREGGKQRGSKKFQTPNEEGGKIKEYASDYDNSDEGKNKSNNDDEDDNKQYSYSYVERYEEPIEDSVEVEPKAYKVKEESSDYPQARLSIIQRKKAAPKKVEAPDYDQDQIQYVDLQGKERDVDYDQARGQNRQHEVTEAHHDLLEEADHHHKEEQKPKEDHEEEEAGAMEHHEGEHHEEGEKGKKGYEEYHEHEEGEKGHHVKEGHDHDYDEKEGEEKKHHEEAGFHEEHEKGEEGEKKAAFSEKGKHNKGHSTKGEHVIHKKDEFEKKTEFFDEFHEDGDIDKEGGYHEHHHHEKGGHYKKGHEHEGQHEKKHGEKGKHEKGHHHHEKKGHDEHEGHDHHHHHEERHGKKGGHEDAKMWRHKKGERR